MSIVSSGGGGESKVAIAKTETQLVVALKVFYTDAATFVENNGVWNEDKTTEDFDFMWHEKFRSEGLDVSEYALEKVIPNHPYSKPKYWTFKLPKELEKNYTLLDQESTWQVSAFSELTLAVQKVADITSDLVKDAKDQLVVKLNKLQKGASTTIQTINKQRETFGKLSDGKMIEIEYEGLEVNDAGRIVKVSGKMFVPWNSEKMIKTSGKVAAFSKVKLCGTFEGLENGSHAWFIIRKRTEVKRLGDGTTTSSMTALDPADGSWSQVEMIKFSIEKHPNWKEHQKKTALVSMSEVKNQIAEHSKTTLDKVGKELQLIGVCYKAS